MVIDYTLLSLALGLIYAVIIKFAPDFPISPEVLLAFLVWALARLGVEVSAPSVRGFMVRRGFLK